MGWASREHFELSTELLEWEQAHKGISEDKEPEYIKKKRRRYKEIIEQEKKQKLEDCEV
jgi:hypothetical protein